MFLNTIQDISTSHVQRCSAWLIISTASRPPHKRSIRIDVSDRRPGALDVGQDLTGLRDADCSPDLTGGVFSPALVLLLHDKIFLHDWSLLNLNLKRGGAPSNSFSVVSDYNPRKLLPIVAILEPTVRDQSSDCRDCCWMVPAARGLNLGKHTADITSKGRSAILCARTAMLIKWLRRQIKTSAVPPVPSAL